MTTFQSGTPLALVAHLPFLRIAVADMSMSWNVYVDNLLREYVERFHPEISCSYQLFSIQSLDVKGLVEGG